MSEDRKETTVSILANLSGPSDLRDLDDDDLSRLAAEIRELLITTVASTGSSSRRPTASSGTRATSPTSTRC
jgi:hypothetical protein